MEFEKFLRETQRNLEDIDIQKVILNLCQAYKQKDESIVAELEPQAIIIGEELYGRNGSDKELSKWIHLCGRPGKLETASLFFLWRDILNKASLRRIDLRRGLEVKDLLDYAPKLYPGSRDSDILNLLERLVEAYKFYDKSTIAELEPQAIIIGEELYQSGGRTKMGRMLYQLSRTPPWGDLATAGRILDKLWGRYWKKKKE